MSRNDLCLPITTWCLTMLLYWMYKVGGRSDRGRSAKEGTNSDHHVHITPSNLALWCAHTTAYLLLLSSPQRRVVQTSNLRRSYPPLEHAAAYTMRWRASHKGVYISAAMALPFLTIPRGNQGVGRVPLGSVDVPLHLDACRRRCTSRPAYVGAYITVLCAPSNCSLWCVVPMLK